MLQAGTDFTFMPEETGAIRARLQYTQAFAPGETSVDMAQQAYVHYSPTPGTTQLIAQP